MKSLLFLLCILSAPSLRAAGEYVEVSYPPSDRKGELIFGVTYTLWIPDKVKTIRGVIVHQHGCGSGACKGGETAAYDLHWQALAKKWDCALLGPSYQQEDKQNCRMWCDPRNGSEQRFLQALKDLAVKSKHPEIERAPWCLWGHSGGSFWASLMQTKHADRIVAIWFRSGTAYAAWEKSEIPKPELPEAVYSIPMICNPGAKEKDDKRFGGAWTGAMDIFKAYRAKGASIAFAPDPRTSHECGDSRYLAIPFFDVCLSLRLPEKDGQDQKLKSIDLKRGYLAEVLSDRVAPASDFKGKLEEANWLPGESFAKAWSEYVKVGSVTDTTAPPPPFDLKAARKDKEGVELTWDLEADLESGLQQIIVERDGKEFARFPEKPVGRFGRPLFQNMSYHDTPEKPLVPFRFIDNGVKPDETHEYRLISVNSAGLKSEPSKGIRVK